MLAGTKQVAGRAMRNKATSLANISRCIAKIRGASASEAYRLGMEARLPLVSAAAAQRAIWRLPQQAAEGIAVTAVVGLRRYTDGDHRGGGYRR